jgi:hypothetical protein
MSNKLIADLMSFRARMVADNRTQLMFEGDFDTIDQAIAQLREARQSSQSEPVAYMDSVGVGVITVKLIKELESRGNKFPFELWPTKLYAAPQQAIPSGWKLVPIEPTWEMIAAPFEGKVEDQDMMAQKRRRDAMADNYKAMLSASPTAPIESDK